MRLGVYLMLGMLFVMFLAHINEARRGRGGRRRGGRKKQGSRHLFYTNPKRKDYYDNANGATITKSSHFDYEFYLGHKIVFICVATGDPMPTITWFKDGVEIDTHLHSYLQISEWKIGVDKRSIKSKLEIDPARQMDSGNYECMANNKYAIDRKYFKAEF